VSPDARQSFAATVWLVTKKDLLIEFRSREVVYTTLFFAVACVLVFAFGFVHEGVAVDDAAAGILWIAIAFSGTLAHQSAAASGLHQHYFDLASQTLSVGAGEVLYAYIYMDPANPPVELMLQWNANGSWEHRAYWGANNIAYGNNGTESRRAIGNLPAAGQWVRLEVPASQVGLENTTLRGMAFSAYGGKVTWDAAGKGASSGGGTTPPPTSNPPPSTNDGSLTSTVWIEDSLPRGAVQAADGGDNWNWINSNPAPFAGTLAHQSAAAQGVHQHYFDWASQTMSVAPGEVLYAYAYLDPANPPTEIMLQWNDGSWEHRAFWGDNRILYGITGENSRRSMGALPAAGRWVRLEVPASQVGLAGSTVRGMSFGAFNGRVTWDTAGKSSGSAPADSEGPGITISAPANNAVLSGTSAILSANASDNVGAIEYWMPRFRGA